MCLFHNESCTDDISIQHLPLVHPQIICSIRYQAKLLEVSNQSIPVRVVESSWYKWSLPPDVSRTSPLPRIPVSLKQHKVWILNHYFGVYYQPLSNLQFLISLNFWHYVLPWYFQFPGWKYCGHMTKMYLNAMRRLPPEGTNDISFPGGWACTQDTESPKIILCMSMSTVSDWRKLQTWSYTLL